MQNHHLGLVDNWLRNIRDVYAHHREELDQIEDPKKRSRRLVELNVIQQVLNIGHTTIAQEAWSHSQPLNIHGWIYEMESGKLKDLGICISSIEQVESIYRVQISPS